MDLVRDTLLGYGIEEAPSPLPAPLEFEPRDTYLGGGGPHRGDDTYLGGGDTAYLGGGPHRGDDMYYDDFSEGLRDFVRKVSPVTGGGFGPPEPPVFVLGIDFLGDETGNEPLGDPTGNEPLGDETTGNEPTVGDETTGGNEPPAMKEYIVNTQEPPAGEEPQLNKDIKSYIVDTPLFRPNNISLD